MFKKEIKELTIDEEEIEREYPLDNKQTQPIPIKQKAPKNVPKNNLAMILN